MSAETLVLVNGSGRIGLGVAKEAIVDPVLTLGGINVRSPRDPFEVGRLLISDPVYGQSTPVDDAESIDMCGFQRASSFYNRGLSIQPKTGDKIDVPFSASSTSTGIDWDQVTTDNLDGKRVRRQDQIAGVVDASPVKTKNFLKNDKPVNDPDYRGRHPGHHLQHGSTDFVVVSSPLGLKRGVDGYEKPVPTFISGVNNDPKKMEEAFERGEFCISASSCSTGAIATMIAVMRHAGFEFGDYGSVVTINHANTESDSAIEALTVRGSTSGSQSEVTGVFSGLDIDLSDSLTITCNRVPLATGSGLVVDMVVKGQFTTEQIVENMQQAVLDKGLTDHFGIETRFPINSTYIRGDQRTVVMDASRTFAKRNATADITVAHLDLWFDNEAGYSANLMRLFRQVAKIRRDQKASA